MNFSLYKQSSYERDLAAHGAFGMLRALLEDDQLPACHRQQAQEIVARFEVADAAMKVAQEKAA